VPLDIVAKGFDAGIGPKYHAAEDMIAVRVMGPMRVAVVGAPAYAARQSGCEDSVNLDEKVSPDA
jgi:DNA-binding transcriptional LysR family regulator